MNERCLVMIVDDEPGIRGFIRSALEDDGYEVREAPDGATALVIASLEKPRVVLLDQMMPGLTGVDTGVALRRMCGGKLPLVFMSAAPLDESELQRVDAFLFLPKPFELEDLTQAVQSAASATQPQPLKGRGSGTGRTRSSSPAVRREASS